MEAELFGLVRIPKVQQDIDLEYLVTLSTQSGGDDAGILHRV